MDQFFSVINGGQRAEFDIRIHTFFDNRTDRVFTDRISTDVDAIQVTTGTGNEETVIITQPNTDVYKRQLTYSIGELSKASTVLPGAMTTVSANFVSTACLR